MEEFCCCSGCLAAWAANSSATLNQNQDGTVADYTALLYGADPLRWSGGFEIGSPAIITYSFTTEADLPSTSDYNPYNAQSYAAFTEVQEDNFRLAADMFEATAGLIFVEVDGPAMINVFAHVGGDFSGWANYPSVWSNGQVSETGRLLVRTVNDTQPRENPSTLMLHELGHAVGLKHPHEGDPILDPEIDNDAYTIMSYNWAPRDETVLPPLDRDALQHLYGMAWDTPPEVVYDAVADAVVITGTDAGEALLGVNKNTIIFGGAGDDLLAGRHGDDVFHSTGGDDTVTGGSGVDKLVLVGAVEDYSFDLNTDGALGEGVVITRVSTGEMILLNGVEDIQIGDAVFEYDDFFAAPDLSLYAYSSPGSLTNGVSSSNGLRVYNYGTAASETVVVRAYLSADEILDGSDVVIGEAETGLIGAGESTYLSVELVPEGIPLDDYVLIFEADPLNEIPETREDNNVAIGGAVTVGAPTPNLRLNAFFAPSEIGNGVATPYSFEIANTGTAAFESALISAYLSQDSELSDDDVQIGQIESGALGVGEVEYLSIDLTPESLPDGDYTLILEADPLNLIGELNEDDNVSVAGQLSVVTPMPNLSLFSIYAPELLFIGTSASYSLDLYNSGAASVDGVRVTAFLSADDQLDDSDLQIGSTVSEAIGAFSYDFPLLELTPPEVSEGVYQLIVKADPLNEISESNEDDNTLLVGSIQVRTAKPDFSFYTFAAPFELTNSETSYYSFYLNNNGSAPASGVTVKAYLSADDQLDAGDIEIGSSVSDLVEANNLTFLSVELTPDNAPVGPYRLILQADPQDEFSELNEDDNVAVLDWLTVNAGRSGSGETPVTIELGEQSEPDDLGSVGEAGDGVGGAPLDDGMATATGGPDLIEGSANSESIFALGGNDMVMGMGGKDTLDGGGGKDHLHGGGGKDMLRGGGGKDTLEGGGGKDTLDGGGARDQLIGGGGKDLILGGKGKDTLTGNGGKDTFQFKKGDKKDVVTDFQDRKDKIELIGVDGFDDVAVSQKGDDVLVRALNVQITLEDEDAANITASDFIFS